MQGLNPGPPPVKADSLLSEPPGSPSSKCTGHYPLDRGVLVQQLLPASAVLGGGGRLCVPLEPRRLVMGAHDHAWSPGGCTGSLWLLLTSAVATHACLQSLRGHQSTQGERRWQVLPSPHSPPKQWFLVSKAGQASSLYTLSWSHTRSIPFRQFLCHQPQSPPGVWPAAPSPHPHWWARLPVWGVQAATLTSVQVSLCPGSHRLFAVLSRMLWSSPPVPAVLPASMGEPMVWEPFLFCSSLPGMQVPSQLLFLFLFLFFCPTQLCCLALFEVWGLLLVFSRYSLRIIPHRGVFFTDLC